MTASPALRGAHIIRCRECEQEVVVDDNGGGYGLARCACREMPIAEGVWFPDANSLQRELIDATARGDRRRARDLVLGKHAAKMRWLTRLGVRPTFQRFVRHRVLSDATSALHLLPLLRALPRNKVTKTLTAAAQWNPYMRHRFSIPSMLANVPLLGLVVNRDGLVLDAPCGMGHLSFLLSKLVAPSRMVCMDVSPAFVYSARRFFVPGIGAAIVHDMNDPLPLDSGEFAAVFCADAFHYIGNRSALAREFMRIVRRDGVVVIAHAHNRLQGNAYPGHAMSPTEYTALFQGHRVRLFPERYVLDAYLDDTPLDLTRQFSTEELERSPALVVVAAKTPEAFSVIPPVRNLLVDTACNPRLNQLYRMRRREGQIIFERNIPDSLREEFAEYRQILAEHITVPASQLVRENGRTRFANHRELLARHVLVDLPEQY